MDEQDKTYMWLVLITFLALIVACFFSFLEMSEMQQPVAASDPFSAG